MAMIYVDFAVCSIGVISSAVAAVLWFYASRIEGSKADLALLGIEPDNYFEVDNAGASLRDQISAIPQLREAGLGDDVIRQVLSDQPVSRAEYQMVQQLQHERLNTPEWRAKLATGDFATKRESLLMSVVLASKIIEEN